MSGSLRQAMAWIHGWLGLLAGWILFAMTLTGTASYVRPEITRWMRPELRARAVAPAVAADAAVRHLSRIGAGDLQWYVTLPDARSPVTRAFVVPAPGAPPVPELTLDPASGAPVRARETLGGELFYRFHFQLQLPYPWGRWLAGLCAMAMLAAILSGVVTHKRIFADLFTLRWGKGQRSWLDAHAAAAVLALPYHMAMTYTGLMALATLYMPWPILANYARPLAYGAELYRVPVDGPASGRPAPLVAVGPLVRDAERWFGAPAGRLVVRNPGDAAATIAIYRDGGATLDARAPVAIYSGEDGRRLATITGGGAGAATTGVMLGLHVAQFARPMLRALLVLLGLSCAAMVGTGLVLWTTARRRPGRAPFPGVALVERLNLAVIGGLPAGMAAYLLANRLIPANLPGRAGGEVAAMFGTWEALALLQLARPGRRAWVELSAVGAALFAGAALADVATGVLPAALARGDALFPAFDAVLLALAVLLAFGAARIARGPAARPARGRAATVPARG